SRTWTLMYPLVRSAQECTARHSRLAMPVVACRPISGHVINSSIPIVYFALAAACLVPGPIPRSILAVVRALRPPRPLTIRINVAEQAFAPQVPKPQQKILDALAR